MDLLKKFISLTLVFSMLFGNKLQAPYAYSASPNRLDTKSKIAIAGTVVATSLIGFIAGGLATRGGPKSENGVDMSRITERGYNNKNVKVEDLKTGQEKADYLIDKWSRTIKTDFKDFPHKFYFKGEKPYNRIPIYFATSLPTINDMGSLTEDDLRRGASLFGYKSDKKYNNLNYFPQDNPNKLSDEMKEAVKRNFKKYGLLQPDDFCHYNVEDPLYGPTKPKYLVPSVKDKINGYNWCIDDLLILCMFNPPNEKYFKLYYYKDKQGVLRPYERFDFNQWMKDSGTNENPKQFVKDIIEIFGSGGGEMDSSKAFWVIGKEFNLNEAQNKLAEKYPKLFGKNNQI